MRLDQARSKWRGLSTRERSLTGIALGLIGLALLNFGIVSPYMKYVEELQARVGTDAVRLAKMQRQADRKDEVGGLAATLRTRLAAAQKQLIPGATPALAASRLQERMQDLASTSGLQVITTQVMRDETVGSFRKASVQMTFRGDTLAMADFVSSVEYGEWLLSVSRLEVRSTRAGPGISHNRAGKTRPPLTVTFEVEGFMQSQGATTGR